MINKTCWAEGGHATICVSVSDKMCLVQQANS